MSSASRERAEALVERGFAAYARGQVAQAILEWQRAASLDAECRGQAERLIETASALFPAGPAGTDTQLRPHSQALLAARTGWCLVGGASASTGIEPGANPLPAMARSAAATDENASGARLRAMTMASPIPALLAASMPVLGAHQVASGADGEMTRPLDGGARSERAPVRQPKLTVVELAARVQDALTHGDARRAAELAESGMAENEREPDGSAEAIEAMRSACERAFSAFVGPLTATPVLTVPRALLATQKLTPLGRRLVYQVDGTASIQRVLEMTATGRFEGLRAMAGLMRAGIVRV